MARKIHLFNALLVLLIVLTAIAPTVRAWTQADFEIFDLVDELEKSEGKDVNFYSWLNVSPSATSADINRAYRKLSLKLHPDKNVHDRKAKEKFARLGKIVAILRNPATRERYDFFYKNGVPRWRGTGYYYSRFRPGLLSVIVFLLGLTGCMQYMVSWINYHQERKRIANFVKDARAAMSYKVPKSQGAPTLGRSFIEVGGRTLRCEVKSDEYLIVYPEDDKEPIHLNIKWVPRPSIINNVYLISWPMRLLGLKKENKMVKMEEQEEDQGVPDADNIKTSKKSKSIPVTGSKVGGRRRATRKSDK